MTMIIDKLTGKGDCLSLIDPPQSVSTGGFPMCNFA